jgi:hypothetical protein
MDTNNLHLIYVNPIGKDSNGVYEYEFFFSETPEIVWGEDWNVACPSACGNLLPDPSTYSEVKHLRTHIPLFCAQENSCFSMQDVIDGLLCLCFYEDEEGNFNKFDFGEPYENVIKKINF